jgi:hypothetical protein
MAMSADSDWLDKFEEGNAAGGHAGDVEAIPHPAVSPSMTSADFPHPGARITPRGAMVKAGSHDNRCWRGRYSSRNR